MTLAFKRGGMISGMAQGLLEETIYNKVVNIEILHIIVLYFATS